MRDIFAVQVPEELMLTVWAIGMLSDKLTGFVGLDDFVLTVVSAYLKAYGDEKLSPVKMFDLLYSLST